MAPAPTSDHRQRLYAALLGALRPVASMLLRFGIGYREFAEACRLAFVQAATEEFGSRGRPASVSRVAVMTGLSRKQVRRLRDLAAAGGSPSELGDSRPGDVLHRWHTDPTFAEAPGRPRLLSWEGPEPSFVNLVRACAGDVPPGALRAELRRVGALVEEPDGRLRAVRRYVVPAEAEARLLAGLAWGLRPLALTVAHNVSPAGAYRPRFQRTVDSRAVPRVRVPEVEERLTARLSELSEQLDDYLAELEPAAEINVDPCTVGVGLYFFAVDERPQPAASNVAARGT